MPIALSTRWNAFRHTDGEALGDEILGIGIRHVELGYDLTADLAPGVKRHVDRGTLKVTSVHNFCPVPAGAPTGHPELFQLADRGPRLREAAVRHTLNTLRFAAEMGAAAVVVHAGNTRMRHHTRRLIALHEAGLRHTPKYERLRMKLIVTREKKVGRHLDALRRALDALLPECAALRCRLCLENLPSWEAVPSEAETLELMKQFASPWLGYWHDTGHGQVRQNLGFTDHAHWLGKLEPYLGGLHVHDVAPPAADHLMPPRGNLDFGALAAAAPGDRPLVLEPAPGTPVEDVVEGLSVIAAAWGLAAADKAKGTAR